MWDIYIHTQQPTYPHAHMHTTHTHPNTHPNTHTQRLETMAELVIYTCSFTLRAYSTHSDLSMVGSCFLPMRKLAEMQTYCAWARTCCMSEWKMMNFGCRPYIHTQITHKCRNNFTYIKHIHNRTSANLYYYRIPSKKGWWTVRRNILNEKRNLVNIQRIHHTYTPHTQTNKPRGS